MEALAQPVSLHMKAVGGSCVGPRVHLQVQSRVHAACFRSRQNIGGAFFASQTPRLKQHLKQFLPSPPPTSSSRVFSPIRSLKEALTTTTTTSAGSIPSLPAVPAPPAHLLPLADLPAFVARGPLLRKVGLSLEDVQRDAESWAALAHDLAVQLGFDMADVSDSQLRRIFHYYLPVFSWCWQQLQRRRAEVGEGAAPLVIGLSAPQGCGKTTVVESLEHLFHVAGCTAASISVDDFYWTAAEQASVREANAGNRLLELRGNAGSHDLPLGVQTVKELKQANKKGVTVSLPRYDKSAFSGRGDRAPPSAWSCVTGPVDVVLFEGWMLGFEPRGGEEAAVVDPQLPAVNALLGQYDAWHREVDSWVVIQVANTDWVFNWRLQAEVAMRATGKPGMTDDEVRDFVTRYIPAYKAYLPALYAKGPKGSQPEHTLRIDIDEGRNPVG